MKQEKHPKWVSTYTGSHQGTNFDSVPENSKQQKNLVYGLKGLAEFLHQSITTAWRVKNDPRYQAAIYQRGRCIITDTDKLMELMCLDSQPDKPTFYQTPTSYSYEEGEDR